MHVVVQHRSSSRAGTAWPGALAGVLLLAGLASSSAFAQTPPDAGSLSREIDRNRQPPPPPKPPPTTLDPATARPGAGGVTITVRGFRFTGNTLLGDAPLQQAVAPFVGKTLDLTGLQAAAGAVSERYREAGWVVRTLLPRQEVDGGIVQIDVVEARLGRVMLSGPAPRRVPEKLLLDLVRGSQQPGQPLSRTAMDRGIMLADDLPGVSVAGFLAPGRGEAETDVALRTSDEPIAIGDVTLDNAGTVDAGTTGSLTVAGDASMSTSNAYGVSFGALGTGFAIDGAPGAGDGVVNTAKAASTTSERQDEVTVTLVRQPEQTLEGFVSVFVPRDTATSGAGFTFALPAEIVTSAQAGSGGLEIRLSNGSPLPSWLKFDAEKRAFVAGAVPDGGLPLQVVITNGRTRTVLVISERQ